VRVEVPAMLRSSYTAFSQAMNTPSTVSLKSAMAVSDCAGTGDATPAVASAARDKPYQNLIRSRPSECVARDAT